METQTSEPDGQSEAAAGGEGGRGKRRRGRGQPGARRAGKEEREGRAEARVARPALQATLFPTARFKFWSPATTQVPDARSPGGDALAGSSPLNALSGKRQSRSEPRYLRSCARARPPALRLPAGRVT